MIISLREAGRLVHALLTAGRPNPVRRRPKHDRCCSVVTPGNVYKDGFAPAKAKWPADFRRFSAMPSLDRQMPQLVVK